MRTWRDQTCVRCVRNDFDELKANILLTLLWSTGEEGSSEASKREGQGGADAEKADVEPETDIVHLVLNIVEKAVLRRSWC